MNANQQKYYKEIQSIVESRGGTLLSNEYINSQTKLEILCGCGNKYNTILRTIRVSALCPSCKAKEKQNTKEKFFQILNEKQGELICEYENAAKPIQILCANGHLFTTKGSYIVRGSWCKPCAVDKTRTKCRKEIVEEMITSRGGQLQSDFSHTRDRIKCLCDRGHIWYPEVRRILEGRWCSVCSDLGGMQASKNFHSKVKELGGRVLGTYINAWTSIEIECKNSHKRSIVPHKLNQYGTLCTTCTGRSIEHHQEKLEEMVIRKGGKLLTNYVSGGTVQYYCAKGHFCESLGTDVTSGRTFCCKCKFSKGEFKVMETLKKLEISYEREVVFEDVPKKKYDFYFLYEGDRYYLEYDGNVHFEFVPYMHKTQQNFEHRRDIDKVKSYCAVSAGFKLIRIDYTNYHNIEKCIAEALEQKKDFYVSDEEMYAWLLNVEIPVSSLKEHCNMDNFAYVPDFVRIEYS